MSEKNKVDAASKSRNPIKRVWNWLRSHPHHCHCARERGHVGVDGEAGAGLACERRERSSRQHPDDEEHEREDVWLPVDDIRHIVDTETSRSWRPHTQVDYVHYLVPGLVSITSSPYYWGKMDRYEAEALLDNKAEGSFLLRDSAQDEYIFSVSFRRYGRSLHARIEESGHRFSFDCHDPGVFTSPTIPKLLEYYKDPASCMFFEPLLSMPVNRVEPFSLQTISRAVICDSLKSYSDINSLELPRTLKESLREYHYKHKIRPFNDCILDKNVLDDKVTVQCLGHQPFSSFGPRGSYIRGKPVHGSSGPQK